MNGKEFQLPYDRCIEIDKEVDALLEEVEEINYAIDLLDLIIVKLLRERIIIRLH